MDEMFKAVEGWSLEDKCHAIGRFWALQWTALQLTVLREKGEAGLVDLKYSSLRRHQRGYFLQGVEKLGIDGSLSPAQVAGRYHYLSNMLGGVDMEYIEESPKKVWIRYHAPAWSYPQESLFAVPASVQRAMFAGWHPHNGPSLGAPRLGFVLTKVFQDGEPYDEGYFEEFDRDLHSDERIQYRPVTSSPDFDPEKAPKLDPQKWPKDRLTRARRNFARGYLEDGVRTVLEIYGTQTAAQLLAQAARLCAVQCTETLGGLVQAGGTKAADFTRLFSRLAFMADEDVVVRRHGPSGYAMERTIALFRSEAIPAEIYDALFEFPKMSAKVMGARVKVSRTVLPSASNDVRERWIIEDVPDRLF